MKKILSIILCLITITTVFISCNKTDGEPNENDDIIYTIYSSSVASEIVVKKDSNDESKGEITVKPASDLDINLSTRTKTTNPDAPQQMKVKLGKEAELTLKLKKSITTAFSTCGNAKFEARGLLNAYTATDPDDIHKVYDAEFCHETGQLVFYSCYNPLGEVSPEGISDERAKKLADDIISSLYGEKVFTDYTLYWDTEGMVVYSKFVHGYRTDDQICIKFDSHGNVDFINARKFGTFDFAEKDISKEDIEKAKSVLIDTLSDSSEVIGEYLALAGDGKYYLVLSVAYYNEDAPEEVQFSAGQLYININ